MFCTGLHWTVLTCYKLLPALGCTGLYSAVLGLAVLGSSGGLGDLGGKSIPVDSSGQGGWGVLVDQKPQ